MSYVLPDPEYVPQAHYEELHRLEIPWWQHAILLGRYDGTPRAAAHEYPEPWLEGIGQILGQTVNCLTAEAQLARHGRFRAFAGARHLPNLEQPDEFNRHLLSFLTRALP